MIKKLNSYLLVNYPIIWNTKVIPMLLVAAIIHVCFYLMGYLSYISFKDLGEYATLSKKAGVILLSILTSLLFFVFWFLGFLKNNAFKKIYPHTKLKLLLEFVLIFLLFLSSVFFFKSHETGEYHHVRKLTKHIDVEAEKALLSSASNFIPFDLDEFYYRNTCDSLIKRSKLQDIQTFMYSNINRESRYEYYYAGEDNRLKDGTPRFSYLYYCASKNENGYTDSIIISNEKNWLINKDKDSISNTIETYLTLVKKYGGDYRFDLKKHVESIFKHPDFLIEIQIGSSDTYRKNLYINDRINIAHNTISKSRGSNWDLNDFESLLIWCFVLSILLFSFRLTDLKTWFISIVGLGMLIVLFSIFLISSREIHKLYFTAITGSLLGLVAIWLIRKKSVKLLSGVFLNLFFYSIPFLFPIMVSLIRGRYYINTYSEYVEITQHPIVEFIDDNHTLLFYTNLALIFLAIAFLIIPMAYKWRSNPEE